MPDSTTEQFEQFLSDHVPMDAKTAFSCGECVGAWRVMAFLGKGGNGEVYRVERENDREQGALKFFVPQPDKSASQTHAARLRFEREMHLLSENKCFGFPRFLDRGEMRGSPYYVMELLEPVMLPSDDAGVASFVLQLAACVRILHLHGVVHRDVKPQNVMRRKNGELVLIDFGAVKEFAENPASTGSTVTLVDGKAVGVGTPRYAAPEQFNGGAVSPATDIHALGMVINECFGGRPPRAWERIVNRSTCSIPELRYDNVDAFAAAVRRRHLGRNAVRGACVLLALGLAAAFAASVAASHRRTGASALAANAVDEFPARGESAWQNAEKRIYVKTGAQGGNGSAKRPFGTISAALNSADEGCVVEVGAGEYRESLEISAKRIRLVASSGAGKTVIRGALGKSVVAIKSGADGAVVRGFTLTGGIGTPCSSSYGFDYYGGGVYAKAPAIVEDCIIEGNGKGVPKKSACTFGGGAFASGVAVTFRNCLIRDNFAWACGGGLMTERAGGKLVVENCTIEENNATFFLGGRRGGIAVTDNGTLALERSVVWKNGGDQIAGFGAYAIGTRVQAEDSLIGGGVVAPCVERVAFGTGCVSRISKQTETWGARVE
ncbi:MAG: protein kinase [Kiritimatiellae bacterium]|nr:protein kinase [Kiritimatiellia bacterium]